MSKRWRKYFSGAVLKLALDAFSLVFSRLVQVVSRSLYLIVAARILGPELYGQLNYSQSWYLLFFQFSTLGLQSIVSRAVGRGGTEAERTMAGSTGVVFVACTVLSLLAGGITLLTETDPLVRLASAVFSAGVLFRGVAVWIEVLLIAHEQARRTILMSVVIRPAEPILAFAVLALGWGITGLAALHVSLWAVHAVMAIWVYLRVKKRIVMLWHWPTIFPLLRAGLPMWIGGGAIGYLQVGPVIVHKWMDGLDLGMLAVVAQVVVVLGVAPLSIMQALLPAMSRQVRDRAGKSRMLSSVMMSTFLIGGALGSIIVNVVAFPAISLILGDAYTPAADILWIAVYSVGLLGAGLAMNQSMTASGQFYRVGAAGLSGCVAFLAVAMMTENPTPLDTMIAATTGYGVWFVTAALLAGFGPAGLAAASVATLGVIPLMFLDQPALTLITLPLLIAYAWATGLFSRFRSLVR